MLCLLSFIMLCFCFCFLKAQATNTTETYSLPGFYKYDGRKLWLNDQPVSEHGHLYTSLILLSTSSFCQQQLFFSNILAQIIKKVVPYYVFEIIFVVTIYQKSHFWILNFFQIFSSFLFRIKLLLILSNLQVLPKRAMHWLKYDYMSFNISSDKNPVKIENITPTNLSKI